MKRPVLVTRTQPGAEDTADRLRKLGLFPALSPMLTIREREDVPLPMADVGGYVFTSANGVAAALARQAPVSVTAWCVGDTTAQAARDGGFARVENANGDVNTLAAHIARNLSDPDTLLCHVANAGAAGDLVGALDRRGYRVVFAPIYETSPASAFTDAGEAWWAATDAGDAIALFHSPKGAAAFRDLVSASGLADRLHGVSAVSISPRTRAILTDLPFRISVSASHPNEDHLMETLRATVFQPD